MSEWRIDEVLSLDEKMGGGNAVAKRTWLAGVPDGARPRPDAHVSKKKSFIQSAYEEKEWFCDGVAASSSAVVEAEDVDRVPRKPERRHRDGQRHRRHRETKSGEPSYFAESQQIESSDWTSRSGATSDWTTISGGGSEWTSLPVADCDWTFGPVDSPSTGLPHSSASTAHSDAASSSVPCAHRATSARMVGSPRSSSTWTSPCSLPSRSRQDFARQEDIRRAAAFLTCRDHANPWFACIDSTNPWLADMQAGASLDCDVAKHCDVSDGKYRSVRFDATNPWSSMLDATNPWAEAC